MFKKKFYWFLLDIFIVSCSFLFWIWLKPATVRIYIPRYTQPFLVFMLIWFAAAVFTDKYYFSKKMNLLYLNRKVIYANFLALAIAVVIMYTFQLIGFSRQIVLGTIFMATLIELAIVDIVYYFTKAKEEFTELGTQQAFKEALPKEPHAFIGEKVYETHIGFKEAIKENIIHECGLEVYDYIKESVDPLHPKSLLLATNTRFNVDKQQDEFYESIINIKRINDTRFVNKFFESVNAKLPFGGLYIGCAETKNLRKKRILKKYPPLLNYVFYTFDYLIKRVFPKFALTKGIYFFLTRGQNRVLSRAEILGRLYSCGFELIREKVIDKQYYFVVHKIAKPHYDDNPTYGPFIKLKRIGKGGKFIKVYKFRTMHPFSEYIQELVYTRHYLDAGGKLKDDFRVTTLGKILRKLWIDELPMLINLFKGQIKIVGVRPLSEHYFNLYSDELKEKRIKFKPGLIPPYYADMPKTLNEIMASEMRYLEAYEKHPFRTNVKYFFRAMSNIIFKHARSN